MDKMKRRSVWGGVFCVLLIFYRSLLLRCKIIFQDLVDILRKGTVVLFGQLPDAFHDIFIKGDTDFFFEWFH